MNQQNHPIEGLMNTAMQRIREMADANTVIGEPFTAPDGTILIPVTKITVGFASGGSDFPSKTPKDLFGGGSGGGVTMQPLAFLVITPEGEVRMMGVPTSDNTADRMVNMVPAVIDQVSALFSKNKKKKAAGEEKSSDDLDTPATEL